MDATLQRAMDAITANRSVTDSVKSGVDLIVTNQGTAAGQISDLQAQVQALKDQIAQGGQVTAEDLTTFGTSVDTLAETNTELGDIAAKLPTAVMAGTTAK